MKCIDGRLKTNLEKIKNTYVNCCQFGDVKQEDEARWGEVRPRAVTWSDLISWCYFVSGGGRLTSLTLSWLTSPRQSRGHWMLRQPAVFDLNCPRPSVHQSQITHLSTSLFISRLCPVFFSIPSSREMIDEYRGPGVSFLSVIRAPLSSQQEDWDWEVTSLVRSARTDRGDFINNYFPLGGWSLLWLRGWLLLLVGEMVTDDVVDVVMLFNILPAPTSPCPLKTIRNSK